MRHKACLVLTILFSATPAFGQATYEIEAGRHYTLVDVPRVAEADGAIPNGEAHTGHRWSGRAVFGNESVRFGAEVSYLYLYWYRVRIPVGIQPLHRDYDVRSVSALGLVRFAGPDGGIDLGAGLGMLDAPVGQLSVTVGWSVGDQLAIRFRADALLSTSLTVPIGLSVSYSTPPRSRW